MTSATTVEEMLAMLRARPLLVPRPALTLRRWKKHENAPKRGSLHLGEWAKFAAEIARKEVEASAGGPGGRRELEERRLTAQCEGLEFPMRP